jgi:DnaJ-class molecular chaperone
MKWFNNSLTSKEMIVAHYKNLCKVYHPDKPTGSNEIMQQINSEFQQLEKNNFNFATQFVHSDTFRPQNKNIKIVRPALVKYGNKIYDMNNFYEALDFGISVLKDLQK